MCLWHQWNLSCLGFGTSSIWRCLRPMRCLRVSSSPVQLVYSEVSFVRDRRLFCSTSAANSLIIIHLILLGWQKGSEISESPILDPTIAVGQGYSESKWCAEAILEEARKNTALKPSIVRVGQLCGGASGYWNTNEWFPALVRSSQALGLMPRATGVSFFFLLVIPSPSDPRFRCCPDHAYCYSRSLPGFPSTPLRRRSSKCVGIRVPNHTCIS
jgi:hypothetical protein